MVKIHNVVYLESVSYTHLFAGRYRLIDFALSNLQNAGVRDVGVVMQRNYSSLLDHIGSGKEWDMSRKRGGLKLLPPFTGSGEYEGIIDALENVRGYIEDIKQDYVALMRGHLAASIDLAAVMYQHVKSGADITAVCSETTPEGVHLSLIHILILLVKHYMHGAFPTISS